MEKEKTEILIRITRLLEQEGLISKEELIRMMTFLQNRQTLNFKD